MHPFQVLALLIVNGALSNKVFANLF